jgi:hypothetical protein
VGGRAGRGREIFTKSEGDREVRAVRQAQDADVVAAAADRALIAQDEPMSLHVRRQAPAYPGQACARWARQPAAVLYTVDRQDKLHYLRHIIRLTT